MHDSLTLGLSLPLSLSLSLSPYHTTSSYASMQKASEAQPLPFPSDAKGQRSTAVTVSIPAMCPKESRAKQRNTMQRNIQAQAQYVLFFPCPAAADVPQASR